MNTDRGEIPFGGRHEAHQRGKDSSGLLRRVLFAWAAPGGEIGAGLLRSFALLQSAPAMRGLGSRDAGLRPEL